MDRILKPSFEIFPDQNLRSIIDNVSPEFKQRLEDILIKPNLADIDKWAIKLINHATDNK